MFYQLPKGSPECMWYVLMTARNMRIVWMNLVQISQFLHDLLVQQLAVQQRLS